MRVELPLGDVIDRATILRIKIERIPRSAARENCLRQLDAIEREWVGPPMQSLPEYATLLAINERLWVVEDALREHEREQRFDTRFIELAREVYRNNDERARLKRALDERLQSRLVEDKYHGHAG
jgi:hypothetical protein